MSREPIRIRRSFQTSKMSSLLLWEISRRFHRLCPRYGQVAHALRTLPPVAARYIATPAMPLDLHVLSLPLAFILSQDQTLLCIFQISSLMPDAFQFLKRINALDFIKFFSVLACTFLIQSFQRSSSLALKKPAFRLSQPRRFRTGLQR